MKPEPKSSNLTATLRRGLFHMGAGLAVPVAALFLPPPVMLISLSVLTLLFLCLELARFRVPPVNRLFRLVFGPVMREQETARLTGASYMLIAALIAVAVFRKEVAVLALSFLAIGDPLATIVGTQAGRVKLFGKTIEGDLACLLSCVAVGFVFQQVGLNLPWPTILLGAVSATIAQAVSLPINDNLTIPLFAGFIMTVVPI